MSERGFSARQDEPLIGVILGDADNQVVFDFAHEQELDELPVADDARVAQELAGAWSDLNWEQMEHELDVFVTIVSLLRPSICETVPRRQRSLSSVSTGTSDSGRSADSLDS
jgi:hypothetical protein